MATIAAMKITDLPTAELTRLLRATEDSSDPDEYALRVLREELNRRLDLASQQDKQTPSKEAASCQ